MSTSNPSFDLKTTADEAAQSLSSNIRGKTVLITGSSGGLGFECARVISQHSPKLIIISGRNPKTLEEAASKLSGAPVKTLLLDLASVESIKKAADQVLAYEEPIDVLIANAGIMMGPYLPYDKIPGVESQMGVNHLSHFLFTKLILSKIEASTQKPRIVNVSSAAHYAGQIDFDDMDFSGGKTYDRAGAYCRSKTANIHFTKSLVKRGHLAICLHPGSIDTGIMRELSFDDWVGMGWKNKDGSLNHNGRMVWKTVEEGTATHIVAAFDPVLESHPGVYLSDCQITPPAPYADDPANHAKLFAWSEEKLGIKW